MGANYSDFVLMYLLLRANVQMADNGQHLDVSSFDMHVGQHLHNVHAERLADRSATTLSSAPSLYKLTKLS